MIWTIFIGLPFLSDFWYILPDLYEVFLQSGIMRNQTINQQYYNYVY